MRHEHFNIQSIIRRRTILEEMSDVFRELKFFRHAGLSLVDERRKEGRWRLERWMLF